MSSYHGKIWHVWPQLTTNIACFGWKIDCHWTWDVVVIVQNYCKLLSKYEQNLLCWRPCYEIFSDTYRRYSRCFSWNRYMFNAYNFRNRISLSQLTDSKQILNINFSFSLQSYFNKTNLLWTHVKVYLAIATRV